MKAVRVGIPNQVVDDVGNVLDGTVVRGKGIDKQVVAKILQNQERTFDKGVIVRQVLIVPNELTLERGEVDSEPEQRQDHAANPGALQERAYLAEWRALSRDRRSNSKGAASIM
jgi:hypothetical protein